MSNESKKPHWQVTWWQIPAGTDPNNDLFPEDLDEHCAKFPSKLKAVEYARKIMKTRADKMYYNVIQIKHMELRLVDYGDGGPIGAEWEESGDYDSVEIS